MKNEHIIETDVLVIGAGAAGIRAAIEAHKADTDVVIISKGPVTTCGSTFSLLSSGWGIQALIGEERTDRNLENFYDDIKRVGLGLSNQKLVRILVEESGPRIEDLISYGINFKKNPQGNFLRVKGCFSDYERAFVASDLKNIKLSFTSIIESLPIKIIAGKAIELITHNESCWGAWVISSNLELLAVKAKATILACGGGGGIFENNLLNEDEIGDGYALASWSGATVDNLEFIQFMLALKDGDKRQFLKIEDLGKNATLFDIHGQDLIEKHVPRRELREKAFMERKTHYPFSTRDSSYLIDMLAALASRNGRKVFWRERNSETPPIEVTHCSHAFNGGVRINEKAESSKPNLFAAGEVAAGPHGADRIGGCMMTATQVFGARAGHFAAKRAKTLHSIPETKKERTYFFEAKGKGFNFDRFKDIEKEVRKIVSDQLMILRLKQGLQKCIKKISSFQIEIDECGWNTLDELISYSKLKSMLSVAKLISKRALDRDRSLGSHFRFDTFK